MVSKTKTTTKGQCKFCKSEIEKGKMTQHLKSCKQRAADNAASMKDETAQKEKLFHILVEGKYNPQYWMHLEVPASEPLVTLDYFFRDIWVECCSHLSAFEIGGTSYTDEPDDFSFVIYEAPPVQEEEEEEEELSPEEMAEEIGEIIDELPEQMQAVLPSELLTELRMPRSRDGLVVFLKERLQALPKRSSIYSLENREEYMRLYATRQLLEQLLDDVEDRSLDVELGKVLKVGQKFTYEYDFGSTTYLNLKVIAEREGVIQNKKDPVTILARNEPPIILCQVCGKPAKKVVSGYFNVEENAYCNACARKSEDAEMMLPIVNSPRVGVCGYAG